MVSLAEYFALPVNLLLLASILENLFIASPDLIIVIGNGFIVHIRIVLELQMPIKRHNTITDNLSPNFWRRIRHCMNQVLAHIVLVKSVDHNGRSRI